MSKYYSADYLRGFRTGYSSGYSGNWNNCSEAFEYILSNLSISNTNMDFSDGFLDGYECGKKDKVNSKKCNKSTIIEKLRSIVCSKTPEEIEEEERQKKSTMNDWDLTGYIDDND